MDPAYPLVMKRWELVASFGVLVSGLVACGGESDGRENSSEGFFTSVTGDGTGTETGGGTGSGDGTGDGTGTETGTGTDYDHCATAASQDDCLACCSAENLDALDEINEIFTAVCICDADAPCQDDCNAECGDPTADISPACETCFTDIQDADNPDPCIFEVMDGCNESESCSLIVDCWGTC